MATQLVYIGKSDPATYDPEYPLVLPGDTVNFILTDNRDDVVTVSFGTNSPFTVYSLQINGPTQNSSGPYTVKSAASAGRYDFTARPTPSPHKPPTDPDQPGTVSGGLEVGTERPPEDPSPPGKEK